MEKALEILRNENVFDEEYLCFNNIDIASAIRELEEAMKPKTCAGCKYASQGRYRVPCNACARTLHDEYEPKDNA